MILSRLNPKRNQNFVVFWAGDSGSGKTSSCYSYFKDVDPTMGPENVIWTMKELMEILETQKFRNGKILKRGMVIIFDEFGTQVGKMDFATVINKVYFKVVQTFRHLGICLVLNGPSLQLTDTKTPIMLKCYVQNDPDPIYKWMLVKARMYQVIHNSQRKKTYMRAYHFIVNGERDKYPFMLIGLPPEPEFTEVERLSKLRKAEIIREGQDSMEKYLDQGDRVNSRGYDPEPLAKEIVNNSINDFLTIWHNKVVVDKRKIMSRFNLKEHSAKAVQGKIYELFDVTQVKLEDIKYKSD